MRAAAVLPSDLKDTLTARKWEHYLTRPFTLFGASLWHKWYDSKAAEQCIKMRIMEVLMVEERRNTIGHYIPREQLKMLFGKTHALIQDEHRLRVALEKAATLNKAARDLLGGKREFGNFREGVDFVSQLGIYGAQTPRMALEAADLLTDELVGMAKQLRAVSYYPEVIEEILIPLAQKEFGVSRTHVQSSTLTQLLSGKAGDPKGGYFIYSIVDNNERVSWIKDVSSVLDALHPEMRGEPKELKGMCAFPGKVRGKVRLINTYNYKTATLDKGDILVSINSNPTYTPLIKKAGAIVTDEGGMGTHAAIVSRELGIPCIVGTKNATHVLKDGDMVEVDAEQGIVRKIGT
jgi:phosphohistidine swiveling domain-containing protein